MGRPLRIDPESAWHHIMNRGAGRRDIFRSAREARTFLALIGQSHRLYGVEVHAYCLMPNHYHLLIRCPDGGISDFMHRIGSIYTRWINESTGSDGPIFRGRFRSLLCATPDYVDNVGRYIHRNPAELRPDSPMSSWRWSSYPAYLGIAARPNWLTTSVLLDWRSGRSGMQAFVEDDERSADVPATSSVWRWAIETAIAEYHITQTDGATQQLDRTITLAVADRAGSDVRDILLPTVGMPNHKALNTALYRSRSRLAAHPELGAVVERAIKLAA